MKYGPRNMDWPRNTGWVASGIRDLRDITHRPTSKGKLRNIGGHRDENRSSIQHEIRSYFSSRVDIMEVFKSF